MWLTLLAVAVGLISGVVAGGSLTAVSHSKPRHVYLAALWVGLTVLTRWAAVPQGRALFLLANVCALIFCALNARRFSMWVLFAGLALNTLVIAVNGSMPYRVSAVIGADLASKQDDFPTTVQSRPERETDHLTFLTDIIPIHAGFIKDVLSIGDALGAVGMAWVVYRLTLVKATTHSTQATGPTQKTKPKQKPAASTVKLGEEHDLDDVEVELEPVTTSSARLMIDLTADRSRHPERYQTSSVAVFEDLVHAAASGTEIELLDITTGEVPGDTFWHERAIQRSRDSRSKQSEQR